MYSVTVRVFDAPHGHRRAALRELALIGFGSSEPGAMDRLSLTAAYEAGKQSYLRVADALAAAAPGAVFRVTGTGEDPGVPSEAAVHVPGLGMFESDRDAGGGVLVRGQDIADAVEKALDCGGQDTVPRRAVEAIAARLTGAAWEQRVASAEAHTGAPASSHRLPVCGTCRQAVGGGAQAPDGDPARRPEHAGLPEPYCQWCGGPGDLRTVPLEDAERVLPVAVRSAGAGTGWVLAWPGFRTRPFPSAATAWEAWQAGRVPSAGPGSLLPMAAAQESAGHTARRAPGGEGPPDLYAVQADVPGHRSLFLRAAVEDGAVAGVWDRDTRLPVTGLRLDKAAAAVAAAIREDRYAGVLDQARACARTVDGEPGRWEAMLVDGTGSPGDRDSTWLLYHPARPDRPVTIALGQEDMRGMFGPVTVHLSPPWLGRPAGPPAGRRRHGPSGPARDSGPARP